MTREEIAKWLVEIYESEVINPVEICGQCRCHYTQQLISHENLDKYSKICRLIEKGIVNFVPYYDKVSSSLGGRSQMDYILRGGDLIIKDAFCSKECFINYIYDHRAGLVELITQ